MRGGVQGIGRDVGDVFSSALEGDGTISTLSRASSSSLQLASKRYTHTPRGSHGDRTDTFRALRRKWYLQRAKLAAGTLLRSFCLRQPYEELPRETGQAK